MANPEGPDTVGALQSQADVVQTFQQKLLAARGDIEPAFSIFGLQQEMALPERVEKGERRVERGGLSHGLRSLKKAG